MRTAPYSVLLMLVPASCTNDTRSASNPAATAGVVIGKIDATEGEAFLLHAGQRVTAVVEAAVDAGDSLETGANGKIRAKLIDDSLLAIGGGTKIELAQLGIDATGRSGRIKVAAGKFWMHVSKWMKPGKSSYEIATPSAVAGVRGTTLWGDTQVDAICALEGTVEVSSLKDATLTPATLAAGNCASELSGGKLTPLTPTAEQVEKYLNEVLIPDTAP